MNWIDRLSLRTKVLMAVGLACFICGAVSLGVAIHYNDVEFRNGLADNARIVHSRLDVASKYVANQGGLKTIIDHYLQKYKSSDQLTEEDKIVVLKQVPIYAAMKIGSEDAEKEHYQFRVFSDEPRNKDNQATPEELIVFKKFEANPNLPEVAVDNGTTVTVFRPVRLTEKHGCFNCHGDPSTSPWHNGKDILGYKMEDWKEGKLHGVFAISSNIAETRKAETEAAGLSSTLMMGLFILGGSFVALGLASLAVRAPINSLRSVATALTKTGDQVASSSTEIAGSSATLSQSTTEQAASLEETAAAIEQMTSMVAKNTENAKNTAMNSAESEKKAGEGRKVVERMMGSMEEIDQSNQEIMNQINHSNQELAEIVKVIQEIGNKTKVINDIVFQTKLLSFNASVEAARAGEHGKGFAVVAEEVGNLAQMSGNAAKEISEMLGGSIQKVEVIVQDTKIKVENLIAEGKRKTDAGVEVARQCGEVLDEIVSNVSNVSRMAVEISSASQEQSVGLSEINKAMNQLDQATQQNATTSEETASSAGQLSHQADSMQAAVVQLVKTIEGGSAILRESTPRKKIKEPPKNVMPNSSKKPESPRSPSPTSEAGDGSVPDRTHANFES